MLPDDQRLNSMISYGRQVLGLARINRDGAALHRSFGRVDPWPIPGTQRHHPGAAWLEADADRLDGVFSRLVEEVAERFGPDVAGEFESLFNEGTHDDSGMQADRVRGALPDVLDPAGAGIPPGDSGSDGGRPDLRMPDGDPLPGGGHDEALDRSGGHDEDPVLSGPGVIGDDPAGWVMAEGPLPMRAEGGAFATHRCPVANGRGCPVCSWTGYATVGALVLEELAERRRAEERPGIRASPTPSPEPPMKPADDLPGPPAIQQSFAFD